MVSYLIGEIGRGTGYEYLGLFLSSLSWRAVWPSVSFIILGHRAWRGFDDLMLCEKLSQNLLLCDKLSQNLVIFEMTMILS